MNEVMADQKYGVPITPMITTELPEEGVSVADSLRVPPAYDMLAYLQAGAAQRRRDDLLARLEHQFSPHCRAHPQPNAYKCQCTFVRMLHWERSKCPRCKLTRKESIAYTEAKAAAEAAKIAKERAKYFG